MDKIYEVKRDVKNKTVTKAESVSLGYFISTMNSKIMIPANQRPYAWEEKHVGEFLEDLESTRGGDEESHFFNLITFLRKGEGNDAEIEVQDGQQRVTTTFLTLLIFYKMHSYILKKCGSDPLSNTEMLTEHSDKNKMYRHYIYDKDDKKKLVLYGTNEVFLQKLFDEEFEKKETYINKIKLSMKGDIDTDSNKKIYKALCQIIDFPEMNEDDFRKNSEYQGGKSLATLEQYIETLTEKFQVIAAEIADVKSTFKIFELVNSRGVTLTEFDKAKNYLYQIAISTEGELDVKKVQDVIKGMFNKLGDNAEEAFGLHWIMFYNRCSTKKYKRGDITNIFDSLKNGVENIEGYKKKDNKGKRSPAEMNEKLNCFLESLNSNLSNIKLFYKFINIDPNAFEDDSEFRMEIRRNLQDSELYKLYVYYQIAKKYKFAYIKNILYYLFIEHLNNNGRFNITKEYKKVVSFYVCNSIVLDKLSDLDALNNSLGKRFSSLKSEESFDLNVLFAEYLYDVYHNNEKKCNVVDLNEIKNKLTADEKDMKADYVRLLYLLLYDGVHDELNIFDIFYPKEKGGNSKRNIVQEEHIFPKSSFSEDNENYSAFNLHNDSSRFKRTEEWLGNKLILEKSINTEVGKSLGDKLVHYINVDDKIINEYASIFSSKLTSGEYENISTLKNFSSEEVVKKVLGCIKDDPNHNEELGLKIEKAWRKRIGQWYKEKDVLGIEDLKVCYDKKISDKDKKNAKTK